MGQPMTLRQGLQERFENGQGRLVSAACAPILTGGAEISLGQEVHH